MEEKVKDLPGLVIEPINLFLNIYNGKSIFQNIITNFNSFDLEIILIGNSKILKKYKSEFRNKKFTYCISIIIIKVQFIQFTNLLIK